MLFVCFSQVAVMSPIWPIPASSRPKSWQQSRALCRLPQPVRVCLAERFYLVTNGGESNLTETDSIFPTPKRHESEDILAKTGQPYQINLFSGVEHGFAVRADISNPINRFAKESAFTQAVAWFNQYL